MISKSQIKLIRSLKLKKFRKKNALFLVEGDKMVRELLANNWGIWKIFALEDWFVKQKIKDKAIVQIVNEKELSAISLLKNPNQVLAVIEMPEPAALNKPLDFSQHQLCLNQIQDPGNLGTIIRTAEWFGFSDVYCSEDCADIYNHKVVQATMGSIFRMNIHYVDLKALFLEHKTVPKYGALLNGSSIYETNFTEKGFLLIGNESKGISEKLLPFINHPISIPGKGKAESLNAAVATGIFLSKMANS